MARLTQSSADDPIQQILECLANPAALNSLYRLYGSSPDIRASLRLIPLAYIDVLCTASQAANLVKQGTETALQRPFEALGTGLLRLVAEKALNGTDSAAIMLADLLDNDTIPFQTSRMLSEHHLAVKNILPRVQSQQQFSSYTHLLRALSWRSSSSSDSREWVPCLLEAVAEGIFLENGNEQLTQLLCLFSFLLVQYGDKAVDALESLNIVRKLARHIIKLLSEPSPLVAAPALHVLTCLLLHPRKATDIESQPAALRSTPLTILADTLGNKLFDDTHMERTLVLAADLCINCCAGERDGHAAAGSPNTVNGQIQAIADDLLVLDAVSGVIRAIASAQTHEVRDRLFQSTKLLPAIEHLVAMAERDRRYLSPLLAIVNSILSFSSCDTTWPLVSELVCPRQQLHMEDSAAQDTSANSSSPSMLDTIVDMVISGIEDMVDTVPHFTLPAMQSENPAQRPGGHNPLWPRVSSDESGCGWFVNCSKQQRQLALVFLQTVLPMQTKQDQYWMRELFSSVSQVLDRFVHPAKLPPSNEPSPVSSPSLSAQQDKIYCDPFGTATIANASAADCKSESTAKPDCWKRQAYAQSQALAVGSYYWTIRPLLEFISKLVAAHPAIYSYWQDDVAKQGLANFMHWANDKYQLLLTSPSLCGQEMFQEIRDILESAADLAGKDDYEQQQEQSNASNGVQQSVATPSESSQSSIAASPRMDNVIGMDDLMAANNAGLEVFNQQQGHKAEAAMLMQAAIICQWARICEAELAIELLQCHGCSKALNSSMSVISSIQQSKLLLAPALFQEPSMPYVLETLSLAISAQSSALKPYIEHHSKLQHRIHEHEVQAIELNESNLQMQARLHQLQTQSAQLKAESSDQSNQLSLAQAANLDLSKKLTEYQQQQQQAEEDVEKWKHSCAQSKSQAERLQACYDDASKQLAQLSTDYEQLQASMTAKQTRWDETHKMMSDSISKLETALHDAVSRLRQLESEKAAEKATADELRSQLTVINAKLSEYTRLSETMFNLSRLPH